MPELHTMGAFVMAAILLLVMPGPTDTLVVSYVLTRGRRSALFSVPGVCLGYIVSLTLTLLGLGALLMTSAGLFNALKVAGAVYLIYLGIKTWREAGAAPELGNGPDAASAWARVRIGIIISLSNPKAILFSMAFFPQFIDHTQPMAPQAAILLPTFVAIETAWMFVYAGGGAKVAAWLREGTRMRWFNRAAGSAFVGAGVLLGTFRR